jgi:hypothetical protein
VKKLWLAAVLFMGGLVAHEVRNPVQCACIASASSKRS